MIAVLSVVGPSARLSDDHDGYEDASSSQIACAARIGAVVTHTLVIRPSCPARQPIVDRGVPRDRRSGRWRSKRWKQAHGTLLDAVPNATLSTSSPGCAVWLEIFRRPSGPASDKTPKNVPPSGARIVKLPKSTLAGLNPREAHCQPVGRRTRPVLPHSRT